jgi:hypothetical protein
LYRPDLSSILNRPDEDIIVCGDLNAHHEAWDSFLADPRGESLLDAIKISPLIILNEAGSPTRLPKSGLPSSPDLSLASAHVALAATWETHVHLNSDHLPITITLPCDDAPPPRAAKTYTNFRKAYWPAFIRESEGVFRGLQMPTSVGAGEKIFRKVLLTAAKHAILAGFRKDCKPGLSSEANILINERDTLQVADPTDPAIEVLNHNITKIISKNKKSIWRDKVAASGSQLDSS